MDKSDMASIIWCAMNHQVGLVMVERDHIQPRLNPIRVEPPSGVGVGTHSACDSIHLIQRRMTIS